MQSKLAADIVRAKSNMHNILTIVVFIRKYYFTVLIINKGSISSLHRTLSDV